MSDSLIQNKIKARQLIDFSELKMGTIYPTDIDGCVEYRNRALALFEMKHGNTELPEGQKLALTRMVDGIRTAGKEAVLFVCEHYVNDPRKDVNAATATVRTFYYNGRWYDGRGVTLKEKLNNFIRYVDKEPF